MLIFIGTVALIIIIKFIYDNTQQKEAVQKQGGMKNKYSTLISLIMAGDSRTRITNISSNSLDIILSTAGGTTAFFLTQTFGNLTVQWKMEGPIFGSHKLEWDFPEFLDQEKMFERISNDVEKYQINVLSAKGY